MKYFWKKLLSLFLVMGLLLTGVPSAGALAGGEGTPPEQTPAVNWSELLQSARRNFTLPEEGTYAPNRLLVTRADSATRNASLTGKGIVGTSTLFTLPMPQEVQEAARISANEAASITCTAVSLAQGSDMLAVMEELSRQEGVLAVEFDRLCTLNTAPEAPEEPTGPFAPDRDPLVAQQTWLDFIGATKAWDMLAAKNIVPGEGVTVAVLDSGINSTHPDLNDRIADGGAHFYAEWDKNTRQPVNYADSNYEDGLGHGSHVSGIIAGAKNGTGITGVAYGAKILPIKVLDDDGHGYISAITAGMLYAAGLVDGNGANTPNGEPRCQIANMSLGGDAGEPSAVYEAAVKAMRDAGILLVVAAGNEETATSYVTPANLYSSYTSPAYITGAFTVMAMQETPRDNGDYLTYFSNWDSDRYSGSEYTLMAPGRKMLSSFIEADGSYTALSGTSMASPAVAGAAALVLSANPDYITEDLWSVLATSGQKRQGKTDEDGNQYSYHTLDVVAALNTAPDTVKSVVKGSAKGNWTEVPALSDLNPFALVIPTNGGMPQVTLKLRGYDGKAFNISATAPGLTTRGKVGYLAPGSEAEITFVLTEKPSQEFFETNITVTWTNADGSKGSETVPVILPVIQAAWGAGFAEPKLNPDVPYLWIFDEPIDVTLASTEEGESNDAHVRYGDQYYFGKNGALNVSGEGATLELQNCIMVNAQLSGNVNLRSVRIEATDIRNRSSINIDGGVVFNSTIEYYNNLDLTVDGTIDYSTIANCAGITVTASSIFNSSFVNNFLFTKAPEDAEHIAINVTLPSAQGTDVADPTGFCSNAVVGPAKVLYKNGQADAVPATVLDCYYLPTASKEDNPNGSYVADEINKLDCADDSVVYVEGGAETRPDMLADCPAFLISTKRAPGVETEERDMHLSYRLVSEFSKYIGVTSQFGYISLWPPYGNALVEDVEWTDDGLSCSYTVYTNSDIRDIDDVYVLTSLPIPRQADYCNPIHDRTTELVDLTVTATKAADDTFTIKWEYPEYFKAGNEFTIGDLTYVNVMGDSFHRVEITAEGLTNKTVTIHGIEPTQGDQYVFNVDLYSDDTNQPAITATGTATYSVPYDPVGDDISLHTNDHTEFDQLTISGANTATVALCAERSFSLKNGLRALVVFDGTALELASVEPANDAAVFSGVAQQGDEAMAEITPAGISDISNSRDHVVVAGDTIATLSFRGKNVNSDNMMVILLTDFFGKYLLDKDGNLLLFAIETKTTAASSGGGSYTPPKKDTQTLPDGTLVTTTTNPDGSIQIVYKRLDGVSSTVKTPAKGTTSTASISVPSALAGTGVKVPIPVATGSVTTVAVLVGADGREQVIPGSFWKDGVLTVPLTGNANIIIRDNAKTFADLKTNDWFYGDVAFVTSRELFNGGDGGFQPTGNMTRSMLVTVLARLDGQDTTTGAHWDSVGVAWAKEQGISDGSGMESAITREQLAVMLYRYAKAEKLEGDLTGFTDASSVSAWAMEAMLWAVKSGIINGADGALNPQSNASRAEVAAMLARFVPLI